MSLLLAYREYGSGAPMVILHGLFGSAQNWHTMAERLGESGPGSAATPGMAGGVSALTSADALPVSSTAPVTAIAAVTATRVIRVSEWVLISVLAFSQEPW